MSQAKMYFIAALKKIGEMDGNGTLTLTAENIEMFMNHHRSSGKKKDGAKRVVAPSAFRLFMKENLATIKEENVDACNGRGNLLKKIGEIWSKLKEDNDPVFAKYEKLAQDAKADMMPKEEASENSPDKKKMPPDNIDKKKKKKTMEPKIEEAKIEEAKTEEAKIEEAKEPKTKEVKTKEPKTKEVKTKEPKTKEAKEPKTKEVKTKEPKTKEPKTKETKTEEAKTVKKYGQFSERELPKFEAVNKVVKKTMEKNSEE
jgi:hypothetical protein